MPLYIADYMADTAHLTTVEHGAYLLLIMTYWQRGEALPDDDKKLARIAGLQGRNWARVREEVEAFFTVKDGKWVHSRIERQLSTLRAQSKVNSQNGKKGARAKSVKPPQDGFLKQQFDVSEIQNELSQTSNKPLKNNNACQANAKRTLSHIDTDTDIDSSVSKDTGASASSDKVFWDSAKAYLGRSKASLIGKWVRDYGREETAKAIAAAQVERAVDPVSYISRILHKRGGEEEMTMPC